MANTVHQPHKSSIGNLDANILAAGCYGAAFIFSFIPGVKYFAWLAPLIIYLLEKNSPLVKFHATQALILNAIGAVLSFIVGIIGTIIAKIVTPKFSTFDYANPNYYDDYAKYLKGFDRAVTVGLIFTIIVWGIAIAIGVLQIISAIKAYKYTEYGLPIIGGLATKVSEKLDKVNLGTTDTQAPPAQQWTPPAATPPAQPAFDAQTRQPITPPAPPAQPAFDTQTGQPITPPPAPPAFDIETGEPIDPPTPAPPQQKFDTQTGLPINSDSPENTGD